MSMWERFEGIATPEEVKNAQVDFKPLPAGKYPLILKTMEASESKDGLPMFKASFERVDNGNLVYYNQILQNINYPNITAKNIKRVVILVNGMTEKSYEYSGMGSFEEYIKTSAPSVLDKEFLIEVSYDKKDAVDMKYPIYTVVPSEFGETDEVPF